MTLKEKFIRLTKKFSPNLGWVDDMEDANKCEQITDEFAIGYGEWLFEHYNIISCYDKGELLEIYKKEKGL